MQKLPLLKSSVDDLLFIEDLLYVIRKDHTEIAGEKAQDVTYPSTKSLNKNGGLLDIETMEDGDLSINVATRVK